MKQLISYSTKHEIDIVKGCLNLFFPDVLTNVVLSYHMFSWQWKYDNVMTKQVNKIYAHDYFLLDNNLLNITSSLEFERHVINLVSDKKIYFGESRTKDSSLINCDSPYIYIIFGNEVIIIDYYKKITDRMMINYDFYTKYIKKNTIYFANKHYTLQKYIQTYTFGRMYNVKNITVYVNIFTEKIGTPPFIIPHFSKHLDCICVNDNEDYVVKFITHTSSVLVEFNKKDKIIYNFESNSQIKICYYDNHEIVFVIDKSKTFYESMFGDNESENEGELCFYNKTNLTLTKFPIKPKIICCMNRQMYVSKNELRNGVCIYTA